ncbi:hypothetical protein [Niveibacterium sp. SC-1]|uniref:hypothetical protein n=1 Tax=Niveibacterium sp. SC-1 TaxID=3135646 RepID=UPI00311D87DF
MGTVHLSCSTTTRPETGHSHYYLASGEPFDAEGYARIQHIDASRIDRLDVLSVLGAANGLRDGEWLRVEHYEAMDD